MALVLRVTRFELIPVADGVVLWVQRQALGTERVCVAVPVATARITARIVILMLPALILAIAMSQNTRVSSIKPQALRARQKHHLLSEWRRLGAQVTISTTGLLHSCGVVQGPNTAGKGKGRPSRHHQHSPAVQSFSVHLLFPSPDDTGTRTRGFSMFQAESLVCSRLHAQQSAVFHRRLDRS